MDDELWPADINFNERDGIYEPAGLWYSTSGQGINVKTSWNYETLSVCHRKISLLYFTYSQVYIVRLQWLMDELLSLFTVWVLMTYSDFRSTR